MATNRFLLLLVISILVVALTPLFLLKVFHALLFSFIAIIRLGVTIGVLFLLFLYFIDTADSVLVVAVVSLMI